MVDFETDVNGGVAILNALLCVRGLDGIHHDCGLFHLLHPKRVSAESDVTVGSSSRKVFRFMFRALRLNITSPPSNSTILASSLSLRIINLGRTAELTAAAQHRQHHFLGFIKIPAVLGSSPANGRPRMRQLTNAIFACGP
jgi:hypothetical protein